MLQRSCKQGKRTNEVDVLYENSDLTIAIMCFKYTWNQGYVRDYHERLARDWCTHTDHRPLFCASAVCLILARCPPLLLTGRRPN